MFWKWGEVKIDSPKKCLYLKTQLKYKYLYFITSQLTLYINFALANNPKAAKVIACAICAYLLAKSTKSRNAQKQQEQRPADQNKSAKY